MRTLLAAIVAALGLPPAAHAADYVALTIDPTRVAPGWSLSGTVTSGSFYRGDEIAGLTLRRTFLSGRGEELHGLRAHPRTSTISFDGRTGRWRTGARLGSAAAVDLALTATGPPAPVDEAWGCRGLFSRVPVRLEGTLSLRTGTRLFKTVRRARLNGFATFASGEVDCDRPPPETCEPSSTLFAGDARASVLAAPRHLVLQFRDPVQDAPAGTTAWYHVLTVARYDALTGGLPELRIRAPSVPVVRGSARFLAREAKELRSGACQETATSGDVTGAFTATFTGWGARTLRLRPGSGATYRQLR